MTHYPPNAIHARRRNFVKMLGMALSALMVLTVLVIFGLILRSESAHDEEKCPFAHKSERVVGDAKVVEQARSCVAEAEEHRWLVQRPGQPPIEFARKRLDKARFADNRYAFKLEQDADERLVLRLMIDGAEHSEFREADLMQGTK